MTLTVSEGPKKAKPVPPPSGWDRIKFQVAALILIAIILIGATLSALAYNKAFTSSIPVTLHANRAGLQMHPNNRVKIRGVDLGRVTDVQLNEAQDGVDIQLALNPDLAKDVPDNSTVSLEQLTAFGNKSIQINYPANPSGTNLHAGSVIDATHISGEINSVFDNLMTLLTELRPSQLNATTGALAETLQGKGESLGQTIGEANSYLKKLNPNLPMVQRDFRSAGDFANQYVGVVPPLVDTARNLGVTLHTLNDPDVHFPRLLKTLKGTGNEIDDFFGENAGPLYDALSSLRPTTSLLQEYAPELTCFLDGAGVSYDSVMKIFTPSGANFEINLVNPGATEPYKYPQDLPRVGPGPIKGPNCVGLPVVKNNEDSLADFTSDPPEFNQKTTDNSPKVSPVPVPAGTLGLTRLQQFFGANALGPSLTSKKGGK